MERVITCPLSPTGNLQDFLKSINSATVGVLIAKKLVMDCTDMIKNNEKTKMMNARNGLAYRLGFMVEKFGKLLETKTGFLGLRQERKWGCPQELWYVAQSLYHLHRGLLLGHPDSHGEEISFLQTLFLSAPLEAADRMIVPKLFVVDPTLGGLVERPAITTAVNSRSVMLIDHGFYMFTWIGSKVCTSASDEDAIVRPLIDICSDYARDKCAKRGMMPELIVMREGNDDLSVYSHLTPSHKDATQDQAAQGAVHGASASTDDADVVSFPHTEELSFYEWCRMVSAEPPKLNKDMKSQVLEGQGC